MVSEIYQDTTSSYRIFSRAFCNFVFPTEIPRPMPSNQKLDQAIETDKKLDILYINNIINLDNDNENFTQIFEEELLDEELKIVKLISKYTLQNNYLNAYLIHGGAIIFCIRIQNVGQV